MYVHLISIIQKSLSRNLSDKEYTICNDEILMTHEFLPIIQNGMLGNATFPCHNIYLNGIFKKNQ